MQWGFDGKIASSPARCSLEAAKMMKSDRSRFHHEGDLTPRTTRRCLSLRGDLKMSAKARPNASHAYNGKCADGGRHAPRDSTVDSTSQKPPTKALMTSGKHLRMPIRREISFRDNTAKSQEEVQRASKNRYSPLGRSRPHRKGCAHRTPREGACHRAATEVSAEQNGGVWR